VAAALLCATALVSPAMAAPASWNNGNLDGLWATGNNWSTLTVPGVTAGNDNEVIFVNAPGIVNLGGNTYSPHSVAILENGFTLQNGVVEIGSAGYIGVGNGAGTFVQADLSDSLSLIFNGPGLIDVEGNAILRSMGTISATDGVTKDGSGTLQLHGDTTGSILVSDGTLALGYDNSGIIDLADVSGRVTIASGALLDVGISGPGTHRIGSIAGAGNTAIRAGTTLAIGSDNSNSIYSGVISGAGNLDKDGNGTLTLSGAHTYTGATTLVEGGLVVNGSLTSEVFVQDGGRLGGHGTLASVAVEPGGVVSPDGTLQVGGNVTFSAGSFFDVDVASNGTSDRIAANAATLNGGTVRVAPQAGKFNPSTTYTILTTANGITGAFTGTTVSDLAFLTPELAQNGNNLELTIKLKEVAPGPGLLPSVAETRNQKATAAAVQQLGPGNGVYDNVLVQTTAGAQQAFNMLSGEPLATQQGAFIQSTNIIRTAVLDRARLGSPTNTPEGSVMSYVDTGDASGPVTAKDGSVWGGFYGNRASVGGTSSAFGSESWTGGFQAGADDWFGDFRLGAMFSAGRTGTQVSDLNASSTSTDYGVGIYGGTQLGTTSISLGASYHRHHTESTRVVSFPGFVETLTARYSGGTGQVFGEVAHGFDAGAVELQPFLQAAYVHSHADGFSETGGASALTVAASSASAFFTTIGVRASGEFVLGEDMKLRATGGLGWRHAFADAPISTASFSGGQSFTVTGAPIASDALVLEAGLALDVKDNVVLGLDYGGQFAGGAQDHNVSATFTVKF
jgi:outer membrane autotransporter protein